MEIECSCGKTIKSNLNGSEHENSSMNIRSILKAFEEHLDREHDDAECFKSVLEDLGHKTGGESQ